MNKRFFMKLLIPIIPGHNNVVIAMIIRAKGVFIIRVSYEFLVKSTKEQTLIHLLQMTNDLTQ